MLFWLFVLLLLVAAAAGSAWGYRYYMTGDPSISLGNWFAPRPEPRLGVTEQANVDGRRRLVLVRRDNVEHLIMTGGPVDVVIETGISPPMHSMAEPVSPELPEPKTPPPPPAFSRKPRNFGQAINE